MSQHGEGVNFTGAVMCMIDRDRAAWVACSHSRCCLRDLAGSSVALDRPAPLSVLPSGAVVYVSRAPCVSVPREPALYKGVCIKIERIF